MAAPFTLLLLTIILLVSCTEASAIGAFSNAFTNMSTPRRLHTATLLQTGDVLIAGGFFNNYSSAVGNSKIFNRGSGKFTNTAGPMNVAVGRHTATLLRDGTILIAGGKNESGPSAALQLFYPDTGTYATLPVTLATARYNHTATLLDDGRVLICGGQGAGGTILNTYEIFDPVKNISRVTGDMMTARVGHTATKMTDGTVFIIGGFDGSNYLQTTELFSGGAFSYSTSMYSAAGRAEHTATLLTNGKVLVVAGRNADGALDNHEVIDPASTDMFYSSSITARLGHSAVLLPNGKVLITGGIANRTSGNSDLSSYLFDPSLNPAANQLVVEPSSMMFNRFDHTSTILPNGTVLITGGEMGNNALGGPYSAFTPINAAEIYNYQQSTKVTLGTTMTTARKSHTSTLVPTTPPTVLLAGGMNNGTTVANSAELFDTSTSQFAGTQIPMLSAHQSHASVLLPSGKVAIFGGYSGAAQTTAMNKAAIYTPGAGFAAVMGNMTSARGQHTATLLNNGKVLIAGGNKGDIVSDMSAPVQPLELFDPATGTFTSPTSLSISPSQHTATLLKDGRVLIAGGMVYPGSRSNNAVLFDPSNNTLSAPISMTQMRAGHTATLLPDGRVLIVGGYASLGPLMEIFDPVTNSFSSLSVSEDRTEHTATQLPNGMLVLAGGYSIYNGGGVKNTVSIFDPVTQNLWTGYALLDTCRYKHTTSLLPDGRILIAGGAGMTGTCGTTAGATELNSAETFTPSLGYLDYYDFAYPATTRKVPTLTGYDIPTGILSGNYFTGDSEASTGGTNSSPANYPLVTLQSFQNDSLRYLTPYGPVLTDLWTPISFTAAPLSGTLPMGHYFMTMFTAGLTSNSLLIEHMPKMGLQFNGSPFNPPGTANFPGTPVTGTSAPQVFRITNNGTLPLNIFVPTISDLSNFGGPVGTGAFPCTSFPNVLSPAMSCEFAMTFKPQSAGPITGLMTLTTDAPNMPKAEITLAGTGQYVVNLTSGGTSTGSVQFNPGTLNCGASCSQYFDPGTNVTMTANPSLGAYFAGWGGACSGTGACSFTINANTSVTAAFTADITPPTDGTLTATPGNGQNILTWSGFSDLESGVKEYLVASSTTATPPNCTGGTVVSASPYTHTPLTNGTYYYYRVCALDNAGNVSTGVTATAMPTAATKFWKAPVSGNWSVGTNWSDGIVPVAGDNVDITVDGTYTVTIDAAATANSLAVNSASGIVTLAIPSATTLTLNGASSFGTRSTISLSGGTLAGTGILDVSGTLNWTGGSLSNTVNITGSASGSFGGATKFLYGKLTNFGSIVWSAGSIFGYTGSELNNLGIFDISFDSTLTYISGGTFSNSGTVRKSAGSTTESKIDLPFNNSGTLDIQSGTVNLSGGGTYTGSFIIPATTTLSFSLGNHTMNSGTIFNSAGTILFSGSTSTIAAGVTYSSDTTSVTGGTVTFNENVSTTKLTITGGTLAGTGTVNVTGNFTWSGGNLNGKVSLAGSGTGTFDGVIKYLRGTLTNSGNITWSAGALYGYIGAVFDNMSTTGVFNIAFDGTLTNVSGGTFNNYGTVRKSAGAGIADIGIPFNNSGMVEVLSGALNLSGGGTHATGSSFTALSLATMSFSGGTHAINSGSINAAGTVQFSGSTSTIAAGVTYSTDTTSVTGGTVTFNENVSTTKLTITGGTLAGTGTVNVTGNFTWSGGNLNGKVSLAGSGTGTFDGVIKYLRGTLTNSGNITWSAGALYGYIGAVFDNMTPTGVFNISFDGALTYITGGTFNNYGTVRKSAGAGIADIGIPFNNSGTLGIQSGILNFSNTLLNSTTGIIGGIETLNVTSATFTNNGSIIPAGSGLSGKLSITGTLPGAATNALNIDIGGTIAVSQYDQLAVSGAAAINGNLNVSLINSYLPAAGDSFTVMTCGSGCDSGTFTANLPTLTGSSWNLTYLPTSVVLTVKGDQTISFTPPTTATYGDAAITLSATATSGQPVTFTVDSGPGTLTGNSLAITGAGTIVVRATQAGNSTYNAATDVVVSITISPALLTITANAQSKTYGSGDPALTYGATGFQLSDTAAILTGSLLRVAGESIGPYAINQGTLSAGSNYTSTFTGNNLTINPATLTVTANSIVKTYGQAITFAGTEFTSSGLQNAETIGLVTLASSGAAATAAVAGSPYQITVSGAGSGTFNPANYAITYLNGLLTVNPAPTITTSVLPNVMAGNSYSQSISAGGGTAPLTFFASGTLPPGITFSSAGLLSGTALTPGSYPFTVIVTDANLQSSSMPYTIVVAPPPDTATITGNISYSGAKTGRIYISVQTNRGTLGTSIAAPGAYSIRGVPNGSYTVSAFMDSLNLGTQVQVSPDGNTTTTLAGATVSGVNITLTDPSPIAPPMPASVSTSAGNGSVLIDWDKPRNNGIEAADSYDIYWSQLNTVSKTSFIGSRLNVPAGQDSPAVIDGLTNGNALYFVVVPKSGGIEGASSAAVGPITVGVPVGGYTVSGTVNYSGPTPTGPLHVAIVNPSTKGAAGVYYTTITNPAATNSFSVAGVQNGSYVIYSIIDMNNDKLFGVGDVMTPDNNAPMITVNGAALSGIVANLAATNSESFINTDHVMMATGPGEWFNINGGIRGQLKRPVAVTLTGAPAAANLAVPMDLGIDNKNSTEFRFWTNNNVRPTVSDVYAFTVTYADGTVDSTVTATVTGVIDSFPANVQISTPTSTIPTFSWGAPLTPPTTYKYGIWVSDNNGANFWDAWDLPSSMNSAVYGSSGDNAQPLQLGITYNWAISVNDQNNNRASIVSSFVPAAAGTPVITWQTPAPILSGTPLSAMQLNAMAAVPGTFSYSPPAGTVLSAGVQTLNVTFSPADTANFTTATASTVLTVNPATLPITATAGTGGSITPSGVTLVPYGSLQSFTITPATGYSIADVMVDSVSQGAISSYSFTNVTAPHTIDAIFAVNTYVLTTSVSAGTGTIAVSPAATAYNHGTTVQLTANPSPQWAFAGWSGDCAGTANPYSLVMNAVKSCSASFTPVQPITATAAAGGSITPVGTTMVTPGGEQTYSITANSGYHITDVKVDGVSQGAIASYTFVNVTAPHTIDAVFAVNTFTMTASANSGGSITPAGATSLGSGASQAYAITPNTGFIIADVRVDGLSVGRVSSYTFTNISAGHTIEAVFAADGVVDPANTSGVPQLGDVLMALTFALGDATPTPAQLLHIDTTPMTNGVPQPDGKIDLLDVLILLRRVVGLENW